MPIPEDITAPEGISPSSIGVLPGPQPLGNSRASYVIYDMINRIIMEIDLDPKGVWDKDESPQNIIGCFPNLISIIIIDNIFISTK